MIYDALLKELTMEFCGQVKFSGGAVRTRIKVSDWEFVFEQGHNQGTIHLISVTDNSDEVPDHEKGHYHTDLNEFPEDCLEELTCVLSVSGCANFVWANQTHRVNIISELHKDYIYSTEYSHTFKRKVVIRNPLSGDIFIRCPDEVTYEVVPMEVWGPVFEQANRLRTSAGIPKTWLKRKPMKSGNGFEYYSVTDVLFTS